MKVINPNFLRAFTLQARQCEVCRFWCQCEFHHVQRRGQGRLDISLNGIGLCGAFQMGCHAKADRGITGYTKDDLFTLVAKREGMTLDEVKAEIQRINRLDKDAPRCGKHGKGKYAGYPIQVRIFHENELPFCPECERRGGKP